MCVCVCVCACVCACVCVYVCMFVLTMQTTALIKLCKIVQNGCELERRVVSQLKSLMDGLIKLKHVMVMAATRTLDNIDGALLRPGMVSCNDKHV